jgi:hypothetical protein
MTTKDGDVDAGYGISTKNCSVVTRYRRIELASSRQRRRREDVRGLRMPRLCVETGRSYVTGALGATVCSASLPSPVSTGAAAAIARARNCKLSCSEKERGAEQSRAAEEERGGGSAGN